MKRRDILTGIGYTKKNQQGVAEGSGGRKFIKPNFDVEWEEAERYPEFVKLGKDAWIELAKKGRAITIKSAQGINNTDAADPNSFKLLDPAKQKRALTQLEKGMVEMPIVAVYPDGWKELVGGNTRLTAMMARDGVATVWAFRVPGEQGVAEAAKWRADDLEGKTWRSPDWDDGDLSPSKIKIDRSGKDVDDSGDELTSRPGAWRGKTDMAKRMTKKGVPTKSELGFQHNLKMRMRMKKKEGGLTGPKGPLPEDQSVAEGSDKLQGTPVVALSDFDDKDTKKDKYGRTVPKKLKKDDPRVKFHKEPVKKDVKEGPESELNQYLLKDLYSKIKQLNQMYIKAKQLGDTNLMNKVKQTLIKVAAKKSKIASELGIDEETLAELMTGQEQRKIKSVDPVKKIVKVTDPTGKETDVKMSDLQPDPKDPTGKTLQMTSAPEDALKPGTAVNVKPAAEDTHRIGAHQGAHGDEVADTNVTSPISGDQEHDEVTKLLVKRLRNLAGLGRDEDQ